MNRTPTKPVEGRPLCFGFSWSQAGVCTRCPHAKGCKPGTMEFSAYTSLAQRLEAAERLTFKVEDDDEMLEEVYERLYFRHYGKKPHNKHFASPRAKSAFKQVKELCALKNIPYELYVVAQMDGMKLSPNVKRFGFQPNMLIGVRALRRYETYCQTAQRRFKTTTTTLFRADSDVEKIASKLAHNERSIGDYYVAALLNGEVITLAAAIADVSPEPEWTAFQSGTGWSHKKELHAWLKRVVPLRAACEIADRYSADLSCRIGLRGAFTWEAFGALMVSLCEVRKVSIDLAKLVDGPSGELWGGEHGKE